MLSFTDNPVIKKRKGHLTRVLDERAYIVAKEEGYPVRLNPIGTELWELLDTPLRISQLIAHVCDRYEIESQDAAEDLESFLSALMEKKLIELEC